MTFDVADFTITSAAFFIACCVAVAASLAASADFLLKSSILDCCSLSLALKSATESCHQWDRSSKKPRFSAGACGAAAVAGGGCDGRASCGAFCGVAGCGPADVGGAAEPADDGGSPLCASAVAQPQASNDTASKAPRTRSPIADVAVLLLLARVTATPAWPIADPDCGQSSDRPSSIRPKAWLRNWASARSKPPHYGFEIKSEKPGPINFYHCRRVRAIWSTQTTPAPPPAAPQRRCQSGETGSGRSDRCPSAHRAPCRYKRARSTTARIRETYRSGIAPSACAPSRRERR